MEKYENLTAVIAENLIYYRKKAGLTQSELAEKLSYSDKSVSKWERKEGVPDIHILVQLSKLYGLTVNDFLTTKKKQKVAYLFISKILITLIAVGLVWFVATLVFLILQLFLEETNAVFRHYLVFIYAIPITAIVTIVFNSVFFKEIYNIVSVSALCWTIALSIYLTFVNYPHIELIFIAAIPFEVLIILFYLLMYRRKKVS